MKWLMLVLLVALAGCGGNTEVALPLADEQVTVLFFYTDN